MKSTLLISLALSSVLLLQGCIFGSNSVSSGSSDNPASVVNTSGSGSSSSGGSPSLSSSAKEVQISWQAPATRLNNEPLDVSDIESYEIVYKQKGETLGNSVVAESGETTAVITLEPGTTYEVVIAAVDKSGFIGPASAPIDITI